MRKHYLTEMDLLRLQKALLMCRRVANSTCLVDKQTPGYSSKLDNLHDLLTQLNGEESRKIVLFSEWTSMLDLIEPLLNGLAMDFVRLDGSVPQKRRQSLVRQFQEQPECRVFMTTNAGATGLNLQAANTVINVDLPWNPALLEQRIARAHRMGQQQTVQVYILVTSDTLEENLLATLGAKHELALAALDPDSDVSDVTLASGIEELRQRLEVLLGAHPPVPEDVSQRREIEQALTELQRRQVAVAGGKMLTAAFDFIGEMMPPAPESETQQRQADAIRERLSHCLQRTAEGELQLTVTLPDSDALEKLARALSGLMTAAQQR